LRTARAEGYALDQPPAVETASVAEADDAAG